MATKKEVRVPVMQEEDYRRLDSFVRSTSVLPYTVNQWSNFLARWNDPNITIDEAKGLLHTVALRLGYPPGAVSTYNGEDSRATCVWFIIHYADLSTQYDNEWQIIEKARQVLINGIINTTFIEVKAGDELVIAILNHLIGNPIYYNKEPYRRKIKTFLRHIDEKRRNPEIHKLVGELVTILFRLGD